MKILAIIPARGGSKGIPFKNIKLLNNKPLIHYSIESALNSKIFNHIVVSTDSKLIKEKCKKYKKILIMDRDKKISNDMSPTEDVVTDVLDKIKKLKNYVPEWIFILQPTSPLREIKSIIRAKKTLNKSKINSLLAVKKIDNIPGCVTNHRLRYVEKRVSRRQDRKSYFEESGSLYCVRYNFFIKTKKIVEKNPFTLVVTKVESIDINDNEDFQMASLIVKNNIHD